MASLRCSNCGEGIHYHSLPQDIEYIYFSNNMWKEICKTKFDKNNKVMDESGAYPKLYRTSTIENDYAHQFSKIWKCPICGTMHVFSDEVSVDKVFVKDDVVDVGAFIEEGVMFGDYLWSEVIDQDISNDQLSLIEPTFYVRWSSENMIISKSIDFSNKEIYRLYLPEWMKDKG